MEGIAGTCPLRERVGSRRASVAIWIAAMAPVLITAIAMAVETGGWAAAQISAQRAADLSAVAGAINYHTTGNKQTAATFAARIAQLNGGAGTASPTWNAATNTLTDNTITVKIVNGYKTSTNMALNVLFQKTLPSTMSRAFSSTASYTVTATGTAEIVTTAGTATGGGNPGEQPCVVALDNSADDDVHICSGAHVHTKTSFGNCSVRSNGGTHIDTGTNGDGETDTDGSFCGGSLTDDTEGYGGTNNENNGQITDPYGSNTTVQNALNTADSATGKGDITCSGYWSGDHHHTTCSGPSGSVSCDLSGDNCTIQPGTYTSLSENGANVTLNPGVHTFTRGCGLSNGSTLTGSSVTVLMSAGGATSPSTFTNDSTSSVAITAATTSGATSGQIPGVVFASHSTGSCSLTGSSSSPLTGVIYLPKGSMTFGGSAAASTSSCSQLIANTVTFTGTSHFDASGCSSYGTQSFPSVQSVTKACLVH